MNECQAFAERVSNLNIAHPQVEQIWDMFDSFRVNRSHRKSKKPRNILLYGDSGTGKSVLATTYCDNLNPGYVDVDDEGTEYDIRPVAYLEVPENFGRLAFYQAIIKAVGAPALPGRPTVDEARDRALTLLNKQRVEMLILDEIDYLITSNSIGLIPAMECIKYVTNVSGVCIVAIGSPKAKQLREQDPQYFRRFVPKELKRFADCDMEFCTFLQNLEEQLETPYPVGLGALETGFAQALFAASRGYVGYLTPIIQEAYRQLGVDDPKFNDLSKVKLTEDVLFKAYTTNKGDITEEELDKLLD